MNKGVVLSIIQKQIYGAWVNKVSRGGPFNQKECVWLLPVSTVTGGYIPTLYDSEHVFIETLVLHAMYAYDIVLHSKSLK